jgi:hypothetical protein
VGPSSSFSTSWLRAAPSGRAERQPRFVEAGIGDHVVKGHIEGLRRIVLTQLQASHQVDAQILGRAQVGQALAVVPDLDLSRRWVGRVDREVDLYLVPLPGRDRLATVARDRPRIIAEAELAGIGDVEAQDRGIRLSPEISEGRCWSWGCSAA